jgi:hypothetical protein
MTRKQRRTTDRRSFGKSARFPMIDRKGCIVAFNRSHRADRRLGNIRVQEIFLTGPVDAVNAVDE